ncbi:MAG TPA: MerR family transcriptional regulator [Chitinophagaceae bacterium]|nr:MerR family transcriptional regulator [Chitinophagaceae bacterium]
MFVILFTMGFTIKELETLSGIKAHTIRIWEQRYQFLKPLRTNTNIRTYSNDELKEILTVSLLHKYGYKISHIDKMHPQQRQSEVLRLQEEEARLEYEVNKLVGSMIDMDIAGFENGLNEHIQRNGLSKTVTTVVFSFLEKVGILWHTSRIHPAHEHIVSNIIRQKIIAAIDALPQPSNDKPLHLLFLPEEAYHELGLLFVSFLLKEKGIPLIYLGANVPMQDVAYVMQQKKPLFLYVHLTSIPHKLNVPKFITTLGEASYHYNVVLSGSITDNYKKTLPQNISFCKSFSEVLAYISSH